MSATVKADCLRIADELSEMRNTLAGAIDALEALYAMMHFNHGIDEHSGENMVEWVIVPALEQMAEQLAELHTETMQTIEKGA